jgi:hypothetical protein
MMSNLSLVLTGAQAQQLADDKRRELAAQWGRPRRRSARTTRGAGRRTLQSVRHRPAEC